MSNSAYDSFLDKCVDDYYEDAEEDAVQDDDWMIDCYIEERESYDGWDDMQ